MDKVIAKEVLSNETGIEEYMEIRESAEGDKRLYLNQGFFASILFTKDEALKVKDFIDKYLVEK